VSKSQWETQAAELAAEQAARGDVSLDLARRALIEIDRLLRDAPTPVQQAYKAIAEADLRALAGEAESALDEGSAAWRDLGPVLAAAVQARALDSYLFQNRLTRGKPDDPNNDYLCEELDYHAIPRPLAEPPRDPMDVTTRTYRRRGLVRHRIIPRNCGGYEISLEWHPDLSVAFRRKELTVVGGLFRNLSLARDETFEHYVAHAAPCDAEEEAIAAQAAAAYHEHAAIALWPELTMPPERRDKLVTALRAEALKSPPGTGAAFCAAGSWHEVEGAEVRNRMHILSATGRPRFHHDKSLPLESKTLGTEQLTPSFRLPVLIGEDALIAFAICRDFCENQVSKLYREIDVDLVIVPSYGDKATIDAHRQQAKNLSDDPGTRAFVVQQLIPGQVEKYGTGFILPPTGEPPFTSDEFATSHPISFKRV